MTPDSRDMIVDALIIAQDRLHYAQARLATASLDRARIVARLVDDAQMTHAEIAALLPGELTRQHVGQLVRLGRHAPPPDERPLHEVRLQWGAAP